MDTPDVRDEIAAPSTGAERVDRWLVAPGRLGNVRRLIHDARPSSVFAALLAFVLTISAAAIPLLDLKHAAIVTPTGQAGVEAAAAFARLFGAVVLFLFPRQPLRAALTWVGVGLVVFGLGALVFGYLLPLVDHPPDPDTRLYSSLIVWTAAGTCFMLGLFPENPPALSRRLVSAGAVGLVIALAALLAFGDSLPALVNPHADESVRPGLTVWHWVLGLLPLGLAVAAVIGAARRGPAGGAGGWLLLSTVLLAGSQLHNLIWPSVYGPVLTTANALWLGFAATIAIGGVIELRNVAAERAALLESERETSRKLLESEREASRRIAELATLKADFTAMVAHELASPAAAIRALTDVLAIEQLPAATQEETVAALRREAGLLKTLVSDVSSAAIAEREDFTVYPFPVETAIILAEAAAFARSLPGDHPCDVPLTARGRVMADPERIAQVLRNLLTNAAKYSDPGTPISVRTRRTEGRLRFEIADSGHGIRPEDLERVLEKFGRGRDPRGAAIPGSGLGLYLSRRILLAHGTDIGVESVLGEGSVFSFELEIAR